MAQTNNVVQVDKFMVSLKYLFFRVYSTITSFHINQVDMKYISEIYIWLI